MTTALAKRSPIPHSLQDVAETLGLQVVIKLIENFGGTEVKFPKNPQDTHPILTALGNEDGLALCKFLAGDFIYIPHNRARHSIRQAVVELEQQGKGRREIARLLGVSQRHVRRMANAPLSDQLDLFG